MGKMLKMKPVNLDFRLSVLDINLYQVKGRRSRVVPLVIVSSPTKRLAATSLFLTRETIKRVSRSIWSDSV